jgi:hypothetical protein
LLQHLNIGIDEVPLTLLPSLLKTDHGAGIISPDFGADLR